MPVLLVMIMTKFLEKKTWMDGISIFPFAFFGIKFYNSLLNHCYFIRARISIYFRWIVGMGIVTIAIKYKFLVPKKNGIF